MKIYYLREGESKMSDEQIIIHEEYSFDSNKGISKTVKEMRECSIAELRLWITQELSCIDSECWWLIDIGVQILKEKMSKENPKGE